MRTVASSFSDNTALSVVKVAEIFTITLSSGDILRFTNHDKDITWDSSDNTYLAVPIKRDALKFTCSLESSEVTLTIGITSSGLYTVIQNNVLEGALLNIRRILWDDSYASDREITLFEGWVDISFTRSVVTLTCRPIGDLLNLKVPKRVYQEPCNYSLFDSNCSLSQETYKESSTATGGSTTTVEDSSFVVPVDTDYYVMGELHVISGNNAGQRRPILSTVDGIITVIWPFPYAIESGDEYNIYPGCPKTATVCESRFGNEENFSGFLYVPIAEDVM